jgi:hypothetical protein
MARRKQQIDPKLMGITVLVLLSIVAIFKLIDAIGLGTICFAMVGLIALIVWAITSGKQKRHAELIAKYGDEEITRLIVQKQFWVGQTAEQLRDSHGSPAAVDNKQLVRKKREVWKYYPQGVNRYKLRITLDDDIVTTIDHKSY